MAIDLVKSTVVVASYITAVVSACAQIAVQKVGKTLLANSAGCTQKGIQPANIGGTALDGITPAINRNQQGCSTQHFFKDCYFHLLYPSCFNISANLLEAKVRKQYKYHPTITTIKTYNSLK